MCSSSSSEEEQEQQQQQYQQQQQQQQQHQQQQQQYEDDLTVWERDGRLRDFEHIVKREPNLRHLLVRTRKDCSREHN